MMDKLNLNEPYERFCSVFCLFICFCVYIVKITYLESFYLYVIKNQWFIYRLFLYFWIGIKKK